MQCAASTKHGDFYDAYRFCQKNSPASNVSRHICPTAGFRMYSILKRVIIMNG